MSSTGTAASFQSPFAVPAPPGAEGWERLYPYYSLFSEPRREFEEGHWEALEAHVQAALRAMDQLSTVMVQVRHDCS